MAYTPFSFSKITDLFSRMADDVLKQDFKNRIDIYEDRWDHLIREELHSQFKNAIAAKLEPLITLDSNLVKRVINETSLVYKWPAKRRAVIAKAVLPAAPAPGEETLEEVAEDVVDPVYEELLAQTSIESFMKTVNRYTSLMNQVLVRPVVRNGKMELDMITPDAFDLIADPEDWKRIVAVRYYVGLELSSGASEDQVYAPSQYSKAFLWTLEDFQEAKGYDEEGRSLGTNSYRKGFLYTLRREGDRDIVIDEGEEIKYKDETGQAVLPFVLFWRKFPVRCLIDDTGGQDLIDATMRLALDNIHFRYLMKFQSFKIAQVSTRDASKLPKELILDPGHVHVNEDSEGQSRGLEPVDFEANLEALRSVIEKWVMSFLSNFGISPANFTLSADAPSGWALQISNQSKLEAREDQIGVYREREAELFKIMRIVWNVDGGGKKISEAAEFQIDFSEPSFPMSPTEEKEEFEFLKAHHVKTDVDLLMDYNPDLTREEAEAKYRANRAINSAQRVMLPGIQTPGAQLPPPRQPGPNVAPGRQIPGGIDA